MSLYSNASRRSRPLSAHDDYGDGGGADAAFAAAAVRTLSNRQFSDDGVAGTAGAAGASTNGIDVAVMSHSDADESVSGGPSGGPTKRPSIADAPVPSHRAALEVLVPKTISPAFAALVAGTCRHAYGSYGSTFFFVGGFQNPLFPSSSFFFLSSSFSIFSFYYFIFLFLSLSLSLVRPRWSRIQCYPIDANNLDTVLLLTPRIIVHSLLFRPSFADVAFHHVRWL